MFNFNFFRNFCFSIVLIAFFGVSPVFAQIGFEEHSITTDLPGAFDAVLGDMNADGSLDIVVATNTNGQIVWLENDGEQNYTPHVISDDAPTAADVAVADIDRDGDPDIVAALLSIDTIKWWENLGGGVFTEHLLTDTFFGARCVIPIDLDGDLDMDIISGSFNDEGSSFPDIIWWENDGTQMFLPIVIEASSLTNGLEDMEVVDLDGDTYLDIVVILSTRGDIRWFQNQGNNTFDRRPSIESNFEGGRSLQVLDVDLDDDLDLLGAASEDSVISWFENDGGENFDEIPVATGFTGASSAYGVDLDGDDDVDLVGAAAGSNAVHWWENNGDQTFNEFILTSDFTGARMVTCHDIDQDGDLDILGVAETAGAITWWENDYNPPIPNINVSPLSIDFGQAYLDSTETDTFTIRNTGYGTLIIAAVDTTPGFRVNVTAPFTLPPDTEMDVTVSFTPTEELVYDGQITITSNDEDSSPLVVSVMGIGNDGEPDWTTYYLTDSNYLFARDVHTEDVNQDGYPDIISGGFYGAHLWIRDEEGIFQPTGIGPAWDVTALDAWDMTADGTIDINAVSYISNDVLIWRNQGDLSFAEWKIDNGFEDSRAIVAADLDGDGDDDLVGASWGENIVAWWENMNYESFVRHNLTEGQTGAADVCVGDMNNDGFLDIVSAGHWSDNLVWWEGDGEGQFVRHEVATNLGGPQSIYLADMDNDHDLDVLGAISRADKVVWWENDGMVNLTQHIIASNLDVAYDVEAKDLNNDGFMDVVAAIFEQARIIWWENDGAQNFERQIVSNGVSGPQSIHIDDIDEDGDWDVVAAAHSSGDIIWWENDLEPEIPNIIWTPKVTSFGTIGINETAQITVTIANGGRMPLSINEMTVDEPFYIDFAPFELLPGESQDIIVNFSPTIENFYNKRLVIASNDPDEPEISIQLFGTAVEYWWEHTITTELTGAVQILSTDVNLDNENDLITVGENSLSWWQNNGSENFTENIIEENILDTPIITLGNLNGDTYMDIIGVVPSINTVLWWQGSDGGLFTPQIIASDFTQPTEVFVTDIDIDNDLDVICGSDSTGIITWWENDGLGQFTARENIAIDFIGLNDLQVVDLDGDFDIDVIATSDSLNTLSWWENDTNLNFSQVVISDTLTGISALSSGFLDGDFDIDLLTGASESPLSWWSHEEDHLFRQHWIGDEHTYVVKMTIGDLDLDADVDFVGIVPSANTIYWWDNVPDILNPPMIMFDQRYLTGSFEGASDVHIVDLDNDGDNDILATSTNGTVAWWENRRIFTNIKPSIKKPVAVPSRAVLHQNFPNPFNPKTTIRFELPAPSTVSLNIYDVMGRLVKQLSSPQQIWSEGVYDLIWDGTNETNESVSSGVYFYQLQSNDFHQTKQMILLR